MKKPNPIAESFAEMTARIRQDERLTTLAGLWKHIHLLDKRFVDLAKSLDELKAYIPHAPKMLHPPIPDEAFLDAVPKRKAVTADDKRILEVWHLLRDIRPEFTIMSPSQIDEGLKCGRRIAGAACRVLVDRHMIEPVGRKGYRALPQQTADGATSEAP